MKNSMIENFEICFNSQKQNYDFAVKKSIVKLI